MAKKQRPTDAGIDLTGWNVLAAPVDSLDGQKKLFGDTGRRGEIGRKEWRDRKSGQSFLFDDDEGETTDD